MRPGTTAITLVGFFAVLTVLSGIAGIVVGGTSAMAGWWLVVVGGALLLAVLFSGQQSNA